MNTLTFGLEALDATEMRDTDGGLIPVLVVAAVGVGVAVVVGYTVWSVYHAAGS